MRTGTLRTSSAVNFLPLVALVVDLAGPVLRRLTKDKRTASGIGKTDVNDPERKFKHMHYLHSSNS